MNIVIKTTKTALGILAFAFGPSLTGCGAAPDIADGQDAPTYEAYQPLEHRTDDKRSSGEEPAGCAAGADDIRAPGDDASFGRGQVNEHGSATFDIDATCNHSECVTGAALVNGCSTVVTKVCAADPFCCNVRWDSLCITEVQSVAQSSMCCSHDKCVPGVWLSNVCSPTVASVCAADPFCCHNAWDSLCVSEVQSVANSLSCKLGTCGHSLCATGVKLVPGCDSPPLSPSCVQSICMVDSFCCNVNWDSLCVNEVSTVCGKNCN